MAQRVVIPGFRKIETSTPGEGGTTNYNDLTNKPLINNVPLSGNLNTVDLHLTDQTLAEEGVPADAKIVGVKFKNQSNVLRSVTESLQNLETSMSAIQTDIGDAEMLQTDQKVLVEAINLLNQQLALVKSSITNLIEYGDNITD